MTLLSGDTKRVQESEVLAIEAPEWTDTWHPVPHRSIIQSLEKGCENLGIGVVNREYSLNQDGSQMFATWALDLAPNGVGYEMGIRNSTDKSMAVGICAGTRVLVCDNMSFSGEFITFRKHTSGLDMDEIVEISISSVRQVVEKIDHLASWQETLKEKYVPSDDFKILTFECMARGVFSPGKFGRFLDCFEEEKKQAHSGNLSGASTLYAVHGAATRLMRGWNLLRASKSTGVLENVCNDYIDLKPIDSTWQ